MALQIEETFAVQAPVERVWAYLNDPRRVVDCLPGAELVEVKEDQTFVGRVKVKIGPVTAAYKGTARFIEQDEANRRVRLVGEGQETTGSGTAKMTMSSEIVALPEGGSEVRVQVEIDIVGKIVQFGRGMIEQVSRQLFRQFATCAAATLSREAEPAAEPAIPADAPEAPDTPSGSSTPASGGASSPPPRSTTGSGGASAATPAKAPVNALRLVLSAVVARIRRALGRGRKGEEVKR